MAKYWDPPPHFTQNFFNQNDSEWPEMDFKHNFKNCNILSFFFIMKASLIGYWNRFKLSHLFGGEL